jgi:hypothetical protein
MITKRSSTRLRLHLSAPMRSRLQPTGPNGLIPIIITYSLHSRDTRLMPTRERRYARVTHALRTYPVVTHAATDRVAIFGDDPSRRGERNLVEKNLAPFASIEQFGTPRDVDSENINRILSRIKNNSYDVVYVWSRFGCHSSRASIRKACAASQTRFEEIRSLHRFLGSVHRFLDSYLHGTTDVSDDHSSSNDDAGRGSIC